jgi:hypothetical protein
MPNTDITHVVTGKVRLSFAHLTAPYADPKRPDQEPKYSTTILLPKTDRDTKARIDRAIEAAKQAGRASGKFDAAIPLDKLPTPIYDGDGVRADGYTPFGDECRGMWVFTCGSKQRPEIWDANNNPIIDPTEVYSGMYARISCDFYPYAAPQRKGVGCGLGNVQKLADGEPFSSRTTAADDFSTPAPGFDPLG